MNRVLRNECHVSRSNQTSAADDAHVADGQIDRAVSRVTVAKR
jgi:hypothetical protein